MILYWGTCGTNSISKDNYQFCILIISKHSEIRKLEKVTKYNGLILNYNFYSFILFEICYEFIGQAH